VFTSYLEFRTMDEVLKFNYFQSTHYKSQRDEFNASIFSGTSVRFVETNGIQ
jgi:hypothetical protein